MATIGFEVCIYIYEKKVGLAMSNDLVTILHLIAFSGKSALTENTSRRKRQSLL